MKKLICIILTTLLTLGSVLTAAASEEETYVFEEIREYLLQDTYLADDGYIGIPISVCTYCKLKPSETTNRYRSNTAEARFVAMSLSQK